MTRGENTALLPLSLHRTKKGKPRHPLPPPVELADRTRCASLPTEDVRSALATEIFTGSFFRPCVYYSPASTFHGARRYAWPPYSRLRTTG